VADKASGISITSSTIQGDVEIEDTSGVSSSSGFNTVCNNMIFGDLEIEDSRRSAPWSIGGDACAPAADVIGNTASVIGGDLRFSENASTANVVAGNTIEGSLECRRNGGVSGDGNKVARHIRGQCTGTELLAPDDPPVDDPDS
jgi:hypothetical protein